MILIQFQLPLEVKSSQPQVYLTQKPAQLAWLIPSPFDDPYLAHQDPAQPFKWAQVARCSYERAREWGFLTTGQANLLVRVQVIDVTTRRIAFHDRGVSLAAILLARHFGAPWISDSKCVRGNFKLAKWYSEMKEVRKWRGEKGKITAKIVKRGLKLSKSAVRMTAPQRLGF